jgi:hypothetical protein
MLLTAGVFLIVLAIWLLGSLAFARHSGTNVNNVFALFTYIIGAWIIANYIGANYS